MTAQPVESGLTGPAEDYLKTIYDVERTSPGTAVSTTDLAHRLAIAPASVTGMVKRLADQGLIEHEPYRGVRLTERGRRAALRTLRRHRVIEAYLAQALGYPWDRVHDEAERLEHAASDELVDRMAAAIGEPTVDPHGAPIPTRDGSIAEQVAVTSLVELDAGARARVARVSDEDGERLRYLASLGIVPGAVLDVVSRAPYGGPIEILVDGVGRQVGPELAAHIVVAAA